MGRWVLWSSRLSPRRSRDARLAAGAGIDSGDRAFPDRRPGHRQPAEVISTVRSFRGDQVGMHCPGDRHHGLGTGAGALAAVSCDAAQRRRLGDYGRCGCERDHLAVVRANTTSCTGHSLQWLEHRWRGVLPAVGRGDRPAWFPCGGGSHWPRHGRDDLDACGSLLLEDSRADELGCRWRRSRRSVSVCHIAAGQPLPGGTLWWDWRFVTLAAGMALGLFAQIGLLAHLFSLLVPALGAQLAGVAAGAGHGSGDRRTNALWLADAHGGGPASLCVRELSLQIVGSLAFLAAAGDTFRCLLLGVVLFGFGIGNATSLPPLIAQVEFVKEEVPRVVPMIVAIGQGIYAFAPSAFGLIREFAPQLGALATGAAPYLFIAAAAIQGAAIADSCSAVGDSIRHRVSVWNLGARAAISGKIEDAQKRNGPRQWLDFRYWEAERTCIRWGP